MRGEGGGGKAGKAGRGEGGGGAQVRHVIIQQNLVA